MLSKYPSKLGTIGRKANEINSMKHFKRENIMISILSKDSLSGTAYTLQINVASTTFLGWLVETGGMQVLFSVGDFPKNE